MLKLNVPDMTCRHCVGTVTKAVHSVDSNAAVTVDLPSKIVTIETAVDAAQDFAGGRGRRISEQGGLTSQCLSSTLAGSLFGGDNPMLDRLKCWARTIKRDVHAIHLAAGDPRTP
jgi:copper chaperone